MGVLGVELVFDIIHSKIYGIKMSLTQITMISLDQLWQC